MKALLLPPQSCHTLHIGLTRSGVGSDLRPVTGRKAGHAGSVVRRVLNRHLPLAVSSILYIRALPDQTFCFISMHTLIVCSTPRCDTRTLMTLLEKAGMASALPASSRRAWDIAAWHERVVGKSPAGAPLNKLSKAWKVAAQEIFSANAEHGQACWGWADVRSTWLLDHWLDFDPGTRFVFWYTPLADLLAEGLASCETTVQDMVQEWVMYQRAMLAFHRAHPDRSVYATARDLAQPEAWVGQCNRVLGLSLKTQGLDAGTSSGSTVLDGPPREVVLDLLSRGFAPAVALARDIESLIGGGEHAAWTEKGLQGHADQAAALSSQLGEAQSKLQDKQEELDLLMHHLHQAQEELERYYHKVQALEDRAMQPIPSPPSAGASQARASQGGVWLKLLHDTQELFEAHYLRTHQQHEELERQSLALNKARLEAETGWVARRLMGQLFNKDDRSLDIARSMLFKGMTALRPEARSEPVVGWSDMEGLELPGEVSSGRRGGASTPLQAWRLREVTWGGRLRGSMDIGLKLDRGGACLVLPSLQPLGGAKSGDASTEPATIRLETPWAASESLALIGPDDLECLAALCFQLSQTSQVFREGSVDWPAQWRGAALALLGLPPVWRFERIHLKSEQVNNDYEHLWLVCEGASYGTQRWSRVEFILSASNVNGRAFSHLPKLEFPAVDAGSVPFLDGWRNVAHPEDRARFELRFDILAPGLDVGLWNALSERDKRHVRALIQRLPEMLSCLEAQGDRLQRPWSQWDALALALQGVLESCLEPH